MSLYILPFIGLLAGLFIISTGGGGGAVYVGVLTAICDIPPDVAASVSLATAIPTAAAGTYSHWKAGNVDFRLAGLLLASAILGTLLGTYVSTLLPKSAYQMISGFLLIALALQMLFSTIRGKGKAERKQGDRLTTGEFLKASSLGLLGGLMSGIVGLSGGAPIMAALFLLHCPALQTVGTSVAVICGMSLAGFLGHLSIGHFDWTLTMLLASGTIAGALAGPFLLGKLDRKKVNKCLPPFIICINLILGVMILMK